jgi:hypothetical protein
VIGYVLDHLALTAGLAGRGTEHQQREMSRLLISAMDGGPPLTLPAVCLAVTAEERPGVANHVAALVADAPDGAIEVSGLARTRQLDALREEFPGSTGHRPMRCSKRSSATFPS